MIVCRSVVAGAFSAPTIYSLTLFFSSVMCTSVGILPVGDEPTGRLGDDIYVTGCRGCRCFAMCLLFPRVKRLRCRGR